MIDTVRQRVWPTDRIPGNSVTDSKPHEPKSPDSPSPVPALTEPGEFGDFQFNPRSTGRSIFEAAERRLVETGLSIQLPGCRRYKLRS